MTSSPTALNKRGDKVRLDGHVFDSQKEADFYNRFVKDCGYDFDVHPAFVLVDTASVADKKVLAIKYTPDFVIYDEKGHFLHVYDVKNSFGIYGIDAVAKLRFKLFAVKNGFPVEAVVVKKNQFQTIAQGLSRSRPTTAPLYKHDFNYSWREAATI